MRVIELVKSKLQEELGEVEMAIYAAKSTGFTNYLDLFLGKKLEVEKIIEIMDKLEKELPEEHLRLDSKDKLIEVLATKLLNSEFGRCYMCTNPMKNITLDGVNNGCDGGCNTSEEFTVDDFLKKIVSELQRKEQKSSDTKEV